MDLETKWWKFRSTNYKPTPRSISEEPTPELSGSLRGEWFTSDYCNLSRIHMIYLLTEIGLTPGGSSTIHIYIQTIHRTTQLTTLVGRLSGIRTQSGQTNWEECGAVPRLCELYPGICLTTEEKVREKPQSGLPKSASWHDENRIYRTYITLTFKNRASYI